MYIYIYIYIYWYTYPILDDQFFDDGSIEDNETYQWNSVDNDKPNQRVYEVIVIVQVLGVYCDFLATEGRLLTITSLSIT